MHTVLKIKHYRYVQKQTPHPHLHPQFHSLDFVAFHTWVSVVHSPSLACSPGAGSVIPKGSLLYLHSQVVEFIAGASLNSFYTSEAVGKPFFPD